MKHSTLLPLVMSAALFAWLPGASQAQTPQAKG